MNRDETAEQRWNRLAAELRQYRSAELERWGNIDDQLLARYLAGECIPAEKEQVEAAASQFPAVRLAIDMIGTAASAASSSVQTGIGPQISLSTRVPLYETGRAAKAGDTEIKRSTPTKIEEKILGSRSKRGRKQLASVVKGFDSMQSWLKLSAGLSMAFSILATAVALVCLSQQSATRTELAALTRPRGDGLVVGSEGNRVLELHSTQSGNMMTLAGIWRDNYVETDSADENLARVIAASPRSVQSELTELRRKAFSTEQILTYFRMKIALESVKQ